MSEPRREERALALLQAHLAGCRHCGGALGQRFLCKKGRVFERLLELTRRKYKYEETDNV